MILKIDRGQELICLSTLGTQGVFKHATTKKEAINAIENLLFFGEITLDKYEVLNHIVSLLDDDNASFELGDGLRLQLIDTGVAVSI